LQHVQSPVRSRLVLAVAGAALGIAGIFSLKAFPVWGSGNTVTIVDTDASGQGAVGDSITIGTDGLPVISYRFGTNNDLMIAHCGDVSCSAGNALTTVHSAVHGGIASAIALGSDGLPVIAFTDWGSLGVTHCGNVNCTAGNTTTGLGLNAGNLVAIAVGADGMPIVAYEYYDFTNYRPLLVIHCGNQTCTSGNTLAMVDSVDTGGLEMHIAVGSDGLPVISYVDFANGYLKVAHCGSANCMSGNVLTAVDAGGSIGWYTSIAIGSDGLPMVSYNVNSNGDVKVAHCGNAECTGGNTYSVIQTYAADASIAIGADGLPVMSYYTGQPGELRVAHCGNLDCTAGNTLISVDIVASSSVGWWSSIAIGADGLPMMSHLDITNDSLRAVHCSTPACTDTKLPTPTATPTPTPASVGGISLDPQLPGSSGGGAELLAGVIAGASAFALGGAAWYARRRRVSR
jgi:hypothetical protein